MVVKISLNTKRLESLIEGLAEGSVETSVDGSTGEERPEGETGNDGSHAGSPSAEKAEETKEQLGARGDYADDEADVLSASECGDALEECVDFTWEGEVLAVVWMLVVDDGDDVENE